MESAALLHQFCEITATTEELARHHLAANNWDLDAAVSSFYDTKTTNADDNSSQLLKSKPVAASRVSATPQRAGMAHVTSLRDLLSGNSAPNGSDDDEEKPNQYFAGGGKNSGISIQDPTGKSKNPASSLINDILAKAKQNAPFEPSSDEEENELICSSTSSSRFAFTGTGYSLGSESDQHQTASAPTPATGEKKERMETVIRTLTFWKNGFSIDDGELRNYDDPMNQEFLNAVKSGRAPTQFLNVKYGQPVELKVSQKFDEDYKHPPMKAFSGSGHRLGSIIPGEPVFTPTPGAYPTFSSPSSTSGPRSATEPVHFNVDNNLPVTTLQIRLGDGTRLVSKFNQSHTLADVRKFIDLSRPGQTRPWILQTTFPNREITDERLTLADANLLNAVVLQKYT